MQSTHMEPPNESIHAPRPPSPPPLLPSSFFALLPEEIVFSCLARISKSYYPKLSLVSHSFRWLILSRTLYITRKQLKTREECVYLGLQSPNHPCLMWFSLWIKPDHQTLNQCTIQDKSTGNQFVPVPTDSLTLANGIYERVGSEIYMIGRRDWPSSTVFVYNELTRKWRKAPSMMVARKEALTCVLDGKIYVMGGCRSNQSTYWAEVFDPKTQTWEPLQDPGPEVRFSSNKKLEPLLGEILVIIKKNSVRSQKIKRKNFVYVLKENKWEVITEPWMESWCVIDNVKYSYKDKECWWFETNSEEWRLVNGLTGLDAYSINDTEICTYGGKLVIFWDTTPALSPLEETKKIWCAVIILDKSNDGEVWGQIEWVDVVRTVPRSYTLLRCVTVLS